MKQKRCGLNNSTGFTLIELLIVMAIFMIVVGAMYGVFESSNRSHAIQNEVVDAQNNLRAAVGLLTRELRMAGYGGGSFEAATATSVHFTMDLDDDDEFTSPNEDIEYVLDGTDLKRNSQVIAENIQTLAFNYTLSDGSSISTPTTAQLSQIRQVTVDITVETARWDRERSASVTVQVRNM